MFKMLDLFISYSLHPSHCLVMAGSVDDGELTKYWGTSHNIILLFPEFWGK